MYGEWTLYQAVVEQIYVSYGRALADLFLSMDNAQCVRFYFMWNADAPLGVDTLVHDRPKELLYTFPPLALK